MVYFPEKLGFIIDTFLTLMRTRPIWVNLALGCLGYGLLIGMNEASLADAQRSM